MSANAALTPAAPAPHARRRRGRCLATPGVRGRRAVAALVAGAALAAPSVWAAEPTIASNPGANMTYTPVGIPDVIEVAVAFDTVVAVTGQPVFQLTVGSEQRTMAYDTGSGTATLRFVYTVQTGDLDEDGVSYAANALTGGTITDSETGRAVDRTFPALARAEGHRVDGVAPRLTATQIVSNPAGHGTYAPGETITVAVVFDEEVDAVASATALNIDFDGSTRTATRSGADDDTLTYAYTVASGDADSDGLVVPANALSVADRFGNAATRNTPVLRSAQKVDGVAPTVRRTTIVSDAGPDRTYGEGDAIDTEVLFSEAVRVSVNSTFTLQLGVGSTRSAGYVSGDGADRAIFRYEVKVGDMDADGISFAADALAGPAIADRVGNALDGGITAVPAQPNHRVDGGVDNDPPRVTGVAVTSTPTRAEAYAVGQRLEVSVRFDEHVDVADPSELKLVIEVGDAAVRAEFVNPGSSTDVLRFGYTVATGDIDLDGIAVGPIADALVGATIRDPSGNVAVREFAALPAQSGHKVDGLAPELNGVAITSVPAVDDTYALGENIDVSVEFSEGVVAAHAPDLRLGIVIGTRTRQAYLASGDRTATLVFRYRIQQDDFDADGVSIEPAGLTGGTVQDLAGNDVARSQPRLALENQAEHRVDARASEAATVTVVSDPGRDETYALGDPIVLDVRFPEEVRVRGTPQLVLTIGEKERRATLVRQRSTLLSFRYVVAAGDLDEDGVSVGSGALVGATIVDNLGHPAGGLAPLPDQSGHRVDGIVPRTAGMAITSNAGADDTYGFGDTIRFAVSFSEAVYPNNVLTLPVQIGRHTRTATFLDGSGTRTLRFDYRVAEDDYDADGVSVRADPLSCGEDDTTVCITDDAGNAATEAVPGLPAQPRHRVDGRVIAARLSIASSPESGSAYRSNERIELHLEYPAAVSVRGNPDLTPEFPELVVSVGAGQRVAVFAGGSGTPTLRFAYTVQPGDADDDGISVARGPGSLRGGTIEDKDGNAASRNFDALPADDAHQIDAVVPVALPLAPTIVSRPASGDAYGRDEVIEVAVTFSETVHVTNPPLGPATDLQLILEIGGLSRAAEFRDGSGTDTLLFAYEVVEGDYDADGISIGPNAIVGGQIEDTAGNVWEDPRHNSPLPAQPDHRVNPDRDLVSPTVAEVEIVSTPPMDSYQAEETIEVEVRFTEPVHVTGEPTLEISIGMATRRADLASGSGTTTLVFHYVVVNGDLDTDGVSIGPGPASLAGGTITDAAPNAAERAFPGLPADPGHTVHVGREPAAVASVRLVSGPRSYNAGDVIEVQVEFTKVVDVAGAPAIVVSVGDAERKAVYSAGTGTDTLLFRYVVQSGDLDEDGVSIPADSLDGGEIADAAGSPAVRSFAAVAADIRHVVDAQPPEVTSVALVSDAGPEGVYKAGDSIDVAVDFDDEVHVTSQPALTLSIGRYDRNAAYATGSGTHRLLFSYVVQNDDDDDDGVSITANTLRGGTIEDRAGNAADRSFIAVGPLPAHRIDGVLPVARITRIVSRPVADDAYGRDEVIEVAITLSETVHVTNPPLGPLTDLQLILEIGGRSRAAEFRDGSGTQTLLFAYEVVEGDYDDDGISIGPDALFGGQIQDAAGNPVNRLIPPLPPQPGHKVNPDRDFVSPAVAEVEIVSTPAADSYRTDEAIEVEVRFSETVHVAGEPMLEISIGPANRQAALASGSGTPTLVFRYEVDVADLDTDGISIGPGPATLSGGTIRDAAENAAERAFPGLPADPRHTVNVGREPAAVAGVRFVSEPGSYNAGDALEVQVDFTKVVQVTGEPAVVLSVGDVERHAVYSTGTGTDTLLFRYAVQPGDLDEDGVSIPADSLVGGEIVDAAGSRAVRSFAAVVPDRRLAVDAQPPTIASVEIVTDAGPEGVYQAGDSIDVAVDFDDEVHVEGQPALALSIGMYDRDAAYATGSGTRRLTFSYVVQNGDHDDDGVSIGANTLRGGTIEDRAGNAADRSFIALGPLPAHTVAARQDAPTITGVEIVAPANGTTFLIGEDIDIRISFTDAVHVVGLPVVTLSVGPETREAAFASGSGTDALLFRYAVQSGDRDDDGVSIPPDALGGGSIETANGTPADRAFDAVPPDDRRATADDPSRRPTARPS